MDTLHITLAPKDSKIKKSPLRVPKVILEGTGKQFLQHLSPLKNKSFTKPLLRRTFLN